MNNFCFHERWRLSALAIAMIICLAPCGSESGVHAQSSSAQFYPGFDGFERDITTSSEPAQRWFNQGMQLLYGFNHDEAIRSFEKAAALDPSCAMAWWGVAYARGLHINNPSMSEEQSRLAYDAAEQAVAALDNEQQVEKLLVDAVKRRYAWPPPKDRRGLDEDYASAMERAWHHFPQDADVGALFAESLMNLQPWDLWTSRAEPKGRVLEILAVLESTLAHTPDHPGANHFYIHAIEGSPWPERGVPSAERLQSLVPGSGHLVHMPSHIFIRVGRYADAAVANQRAIMADEDYFALAPKPDFYNIYFLHNLHFLSYAAMMQGRYEVAIAAARKIEQSIPADFLRDNVTVADAFMPTTMHVLIRFGRWQEILSEPLPEDWRLFSRAEYHFARSLALSALGQTQAAQQELQRLDAVAQQLDDDWKVGNNTAPAVVAIARKMAAGELHYQAGDRELGLDLLEEAVKLEEELSYDEPPGWMQPVRHALGALQLADGKAVAAEQTYREDLQRHPRNAWSLLGLQQSLLAQGKTKQADQLAAAVEQAWQQADVKPIASCYCHPQARQTTLTSPDEPLK